MPRRPEIGSVQLYPNRPLKKSDKNGYVLKFYCPIRKKRIRRACGTRDRREARKILRECRERLLNGDYERSGGAITVQHVASTMPMSVSSEMSTDGKSWQECVERYRRHHENRVRESTHRDAVYGLHLAERIFENHREEHGLPEGFSVNEVMTLNMLDFLQDRLLAGEECRYERRSPHTVNSIMAVVMAFVRYCFDREWIDKVPRVKKLDADEVMKGRPITAEEFEQMLKVTPDVVGQSSAESWQFALQVLWESGFRIGDLMDFHWTDENHIHPVWPKRKSQHPTIIIPSTQKNGRVQEIPMLPGLQELLTTVPKSQRAGWVVNPIPKEYQISGHPEWFQPSQSVLATLVTQYSNCAIAEACCVSETMVRRWMKASGIVRTQASSRSGMRIDARQVARIRRESKRHRIIQAQRSKVRLSETHVGRVISEIGEEAAIVVRNCDTQSGKRIKYASAHDLRRGCAERLINAGVSAETLKVVFRHSSFMTTERHYGASRSAQAAGSEIAEKLDVSKSSLVGGLMGGIQSSPELAPEEVAKLKALLEAL